MLGVSAYPVIFTALLLQGVLFEFGGLTVLGVNTTTMGTGALAAGMLSMRWFTLACRAGD